ncbi:cation transporter HKT1;3 [Beta vulgaris subsp. vulgaris]|uniref:cation transporter HKT1;3 n=1 Tax=Beta vulgaris subsp. vulgaris TaxID=3555 RepID=UPI0020371FCE|nr:cation transporter HKT1;3 [Beta vulgaris subsp. vulgaris]
MLRYKFLVEKYKHFYSFLSICVVYLITSICWITSKINEFIISHTTHFMIEVFYFILVSICGFVSLKNIDPRTRLLSSYPNKNIRDIDMFFTSVSATTVSSMSTIEMEVFSNSQLVIITILMFIGGEVFTSMVGLHFSASKLTYTPLSARSRVNSVANLPLPLESIELGVIIPCSSTEEISNNPTMEKTKSEIDFLIKSKSTRVLGLLVLGYLLIVHILGISMVFAYLNIFSSAHKILEKKGLKTFTFSLFTIVSTFASCGFIPTNENMQVFSKNSGLLLILIPQILLGNTLFPSFLRFSIWVLGKFTKKDETKYLMRNSKEIGYHHLLPSKHSKLLVVTVFGFILVQFILFCTMEWNFEGFNGLNLYQKLVGVLFQCVNSRHTGESIVDLSSIASAILVLFIVMMYLPPYTSFVPIKDEEGELPQILCKSEKKSKIMLKNIIFSQLSYLAIFIMIICITERQNIKDDPLNFNIFNIAFEVISAYGNVGFSTGYSCGRQLKADSTCVSKWYGFAGYWSDQGKIVLIIVMFFGRLKKFNLKGGKAWKLL